MWRGVVAVVAGNLRWTALWLSLGTALRRSGALPPETEPVSAVFPLVLLLVASAVFSIGAGYLVATIGGWKPAWVFAALQLTIGTLVQAQCWALLPGWYHTGFLLALVPATLFGARLRSGRSDVARAGTTVTAL